MPTTPRRWRGLLAAAALPVMLVLPLGAVAPATAAEPVAAPAPVSADALPTVQVDGVVWDTLVVGSRVYATGAFAQARPAGAAPGTSQTPRANILAFDLATGALLTSWNASLNGQGLSLAASADGSRVYVAGDFTTVNGTNRARVAALDATTGALVSGFRADANARVRAVEVSGGTVYLGGIFSVVGGQSRSRLAAVSAASGAVQPWAPVADAEVMDVVVPQGTGSVVVAGRFATLNGEAALGSGSLDAATGATRPWAANKTVQNYGENSAIYSLAASGGRVFGTGYDYFGPSDFENSFAADAATGAITWIAGCYGDTYDIAPVGGTVYTVGHPHNCSAIGGNPETSPRSFQRTMATTTAPAADGSVNAGGPFNGAPRPDLLAWTPDLTAGTTTGQTQAAWTVSATDDFVVLGGEFPKVNGTAQQGLVRFARRAASPRKEGPNGYSTLTPAATSTAPGVLRLSWTAAFDRDDRTLTYELLRGEKYSTAEVVSRTAVASAWWSRPRVVGFDRSAPAGSTQTYRVRATDSDGNTMVSATVQVAVPADAATPSAYADAVLADGATSAWRLGERSGTTAYDSAGADDVLLPTSAVRGAAGALPEDAATTFSGSGTLQGASSTAQPGPQTFALETWVRTTSTRGGKLVGFGSSRTAGSSSYDRQVYMTNAGRLVFGVYPGAVRTVTSTAAYNDGAWHHVVAQLGSTGMQLYVDGQLVGERADTTSAQAYTGYWRLGGDTIGTAWPSRPTSTSLAGTLDEVAVYPAPLSVAQVRRHALLGGLTAPNAAPSASFTASASGLQVAVDGSGSSDADGSVVSYAWDFGDGSSASGRTAEHAYAAEGSYTVRLVVTDDRGATATSSRVVEVARPANVAPSASFTVSASGLQLAVDGSASSDADGSLVSYAWDFGDGATGSGRTAEHAYAAEGSYTVRLVGTDDRGATATSSRAVEVARPANVAPSASFTVSASGLQLAVDGSASSDADGSLVSYAWDFGDGATGSGRTAEHAYAAEGSYTVRLVVTDDRGATATAERPVTATAPAPEGLLARDAFERTATGTFGTADVGGAWTTQGAGGSSSVSGGAAVVSAAAGRSSTDRLPEVQAGDVDLVVISTLEAAPTGGGTYLASVVRSNAAGDYRARVRAQADGTYALSLTRTVGGVETALTSAVAVPGARATAGASLVVRVQAVGSSPTTLRARAWAAGTPEPTTWQRTATDATAELQGPGSIGLWTYASGSSTSPVVVRYDDLAALLP
ncbi:PKD domain-containing protein [Pseudokineococcus sp. 5B2Z-1]|uniref:PKD domain-containing protein n=1 Tax=Pseudokineococcus sp. 5B2Z-1 TaxID=3132744 RepID=UPI00309DCBAA